MFKYIVKIKEIHGSNERQIHGKDYFWAGGKGNPSEMSTRVASTLLVLFS